MQLIAREWLFDVQRHAFHRGAETPYGGSSSAQSSYYCLLSLCLPQQDRLQGRGDLVHGAGPVQVDSGWRSTMFIVEGVDSRPQFGRRVTVINALKDFSFLRLPDLW